MRLGIFFATVGGLLMACAVLAFPPPLEDPFSLPPDTRFDLDLLAVEEVAALKLAHVASHSSYDVLVFGNSRLMPVGAAEAGLDRDRFFNITLSGHSLRSHVLLLEELVRLGRAPRVALIPFDNAEAQYYGNPYWPAAWVRWRQAAADILAGIVRPDIGWLDLAKMVRRHLATEGTVVRNRLSLDRVRRGLDGLWGRLTGADPHYPRRDEDGWQPDGSRNREVLASAIDLGPVPRPNRNILPGYLAYDFERLARVAATAGTRIVIFELFIHPEIQRKWLTVPSPEAAGTRAEMTALCRKHGFDCVPMPPPQDDGGGASWLDSDHPPRPVIGPYVRMLLDRLGVR